MNSATRKEPGAGELTGRKLIAALQYSALALLANLFGSLCWFVEQRRSRFADLLENQRSTQ
jgi:hypothetical protein